MVKKQASFPVKHVGKCNLHLHPRVLSLPPRLLFGILHLNLKAAPSEPPEQPFQTPVATCHWSFLPAAPPAGAISQPHLTNVFSCRRSSSG